jgi:hypothetical protein
MDRKELKSIAASNHYLRGLLALPIGFILIASALANMEWGPFRNLWLFPACVLAAAAGYGLTLRHYNEHYGRVLPQMGVRGAAGVVGAIVLMGGGSVVVQELGLPLNGMALSWAIVALGYYALTIGLRPHHVAIWATVLVIALVPLWGDNRTTDTPNFGMLIVGAAVLLTGVLDHRLLVRTFGPSRDPRMEATNAGG